MTSSRERQQRAAARARLARQMSERQAAARKRRQLQLIIGAAVAVVVVTVGTVWAITSLGDDPQPVDPAAGPSPSAAPSAPPAEPGECAWQSEDPAQNPNLQDVGLPEAGDPPTGPATMTITTNQGVLEVEMDAANAPCTYASFAHLASQEFYDGTPCHRLTTEGIFVLQCGDPSGTGTGGPAYRYAEENLPVDAQPSYPKGTLAMAKTAEPASTGSQFFIVYEDTELPPDYTVVGTVTEGIEVVEEIAAAGATDPTGADASDGAPNTEVTIETLRVGDPT